jgi:hypothetical protein
MRLLDRAQASTLDRFVRELEASADDPLEVLAPQLEGATNEDREAAQLGWAHRIVDEYRSAVRFTVLLGDLLAIEAPYAALAAVQRLIGDELRHARLCARFSLAFGPLSELRVDLSGLGWPGAPRPLKERALEIVVRELSIGEGESIACMRSYRRAATDPAAIAVLDALLLDEARHFRTGQHLEALLLETYPELASFHASLEPLLMEDVRAIRAQHRAGATNGPGRAFGVSIRLDEAPPPIDG